MPRIERRFLWVTVTTLAFSALTSYATPSITAGYWPSNLSAGLSQDQKAQLYTRWYDLTRGGPEQQKAAYESGQEFLRKFGSFDDQQVQTVRKWVAKYERAALEFVFNQAVGIKDYVQAFELGRKILNNDPENFRVLSVLAVTANLIGPPTDPNINREAANFAHRAVQLLETGKLTSADPFATMDEAVGFLNFLLGRFMVANSPADAVVALRKAAQSKSAYSQDAATYYLLASAIATSEFRPLQAEYRKKYEGKELTAEGRAMYERLTRIIERMIDAYARAVALSTRPEQQEFKNQLMAQLTKVYKSIHNDSDAGLNDLIATVLSKPMP
ncbi:MAG: hypothetical protein ACR2G5_07145 [Pyrinomonadaceae bacterium]